MTVTIGRSIAVDPRTLISPDLFSRLVERIRTDHPERADLAESIMEQALAFLAACTARPDARQRHRQVLPVPSGMHRQSHQIAGQRGRSDVRCET